MVLETLAAVNKEEEQKTHSLPKLPLIWLTENPASLDNLSPGSRWLLFPKQEDKTVALFSQNLRGIVINAEESLQPQLQKLPL